MTGEHDKDMKVLDLKIAKALQIDVPELHMPELPDVDSATVTALPVRKRSMKAFWFAVAATVVLATSLSIRNSGMLRSYDSLGEEVLAHLDHEPGAFRNVDIPVSDERLMRAIPASLATFERGTSLITYAQPCVINGNDVPHLVLQGQHGPVTILLMPNESVSGSTPLDGDNVKGVILPLGKGSIAIIGTREELLEPIQQSVMNSVTWTA